MLLWLFCVSAMGKKTAFHEAAERGDSDGLQRLLDEGSYNVNEESDEKDFLGNSNLVEQRE